MLCSASFKYTCTNTHRWWQSRPGFGVLLNYTLTAELGLGSSLAAVPVVYLAGGAFVIVVARLLTFQNYATSPWWQDNTEVCLWFWIKEQRTTNESEGGK